MRYVYLTFHCLTTLTKNIKAVMQVFCHSASQHTALA